MDDVLCGASTLEDAKELQLQLEGILKMAGMEMHKICSNHLELSSDANRDYNFANQIETKTLGVYWKPIEDCFLFTVKVSLNDSYTKRDILSTIAKLFDPLGLVSPVMPKVKIFMQRLWRVKIDWSDALPADEYRE